MIETKKRSFLKAIVWRIISFVMTVIIAIIILGDITLGVSLSIVGSTARFIGYYVHERIWDRIDWERIEKNEN